MNRKNYLGHIALALTIVLVAAFAGQLRRWERQRKAFRSTPNSATTREKTNDVGYEPNEPEVLVRFRPGTTEDTMKQIAARLNDQIEDEYESVNGLVVIDDLDNADPKSVAEEYLRESDVEYAGPNYIISLDQETLAPNKDKMAEASQSRSSNLPDDPMFNEQWSLANTGQRDGKPHADIHALDAWAKKTTGSDTVVVAVLDSGVDYKHPDLERNMWMRPKEVAEYFDEQLGYADDTYGYDATTANGDPMDENGHGTHCAGIIGADGDNKIGIAGINWRVKIMPLKFMSKGGFGSTKDAIEAINYVINRKRAGVNVRIISASWGSTQKSKALEDVIRAAGTEGILFVAASGNASADADKTPHYPASFELPNVISVAALNRNDELASFSNFGAKRVHIAAPGAEILSTWLNGDFREASGTSMATPEVAGVAALVLAVEPKLSVEELRARLLKSVDKLPSLKGKVSTGGRINAARAVKAE
jgi:thermitase